MSATLKIEFAGDLRRSPVPLAISFLELQQRIARLYNFAPLQTFAIKYLDDENDWVTLSADDELAEAFRIVKQKDPSMCTLRLSVVQVAAPTQLESPAAQQVPTIALKPAEPVVQLPQPSLLRSSLSSPSIPPVQTPSLFASQLPTWGRASILDTPGEPTPGELMPIQQMIAPVAVELETLAASIPKDVTPQVYVTITDRALSLSNQINDRCQAVALDIGAKTAKLAAEIATKCAALSADTSIANDATATHKASIQLSDETAAKSSDLCRQTALRCLEISDQMNQQTKEYLARAVVHQDQTKELEKICHQLSDDTSARCNDISAEITKRLMAL